MLIAKSNRFSLFVVGYASIFVALALFGGIEASRVRDQGRMDQQVASHLASVTGNKTLYKMPDFEVTMNAGNGPHHVKLGITLQMDPSSVARFKDFQPKVSDRIIGYLDQQDVDRFKGPEGLNTLRKDILFEANRASGPVTVSDIVFREFIIR